MIIHNKYIILWKMQCQMSIHNKYTISEKIQCQMSTQQIHYQWKNTMPNDDSKEIQKWWYKTNTWSGAPASNRWLREAESGRPCLVHRSKCDDEENCDDSDGDDVGNDNVVDGLGLPVFTHDAETHFWFREYGFRKMKVIKNIWLWWRWSHRDMFMNHNLL